MTKIINTYLILILALLDPIVASGQSIRDEWATKQYDPAGNVTLISYSIDSLKKFDPNGYGKWLHKIIYDYDSNNNVIKESYYNADGKRFQFSNGVSSKLYYWLGKGDVAIKFLDKNLNQTENLSIGAYYLTMKFNDMGELIEEQYLQKDSTLIENREGCAKRIFQHRPDYSESCFDKDFKLVSFKNSEFDYLKAISIYTHTMPKWIRLADQTNLLNGVTIKEVTIQIKLENWDAERTIHFDFCTDNELKIVDYKEVDSSNMTKSLRRKLVSALKKFQLYSLTNERDDNEISGRLIFSFKK